MDHALVALSDFVIQVFCVCGKAVKYLNLNDLQRARSVVYAQVIYLYFILIYILPDDE